MIARLGRAMRTNGFPCRPRGVRSGPRRAVSVETRTPNEFAQDLFDGLPRRYDAPRRGALVRPERPLAPRDGEPRRAERSGVDPRRRDRDGGRRARAGAAHARARHRPRPHPGDAAARAGSASRRRAPPTGCGSSWARASGSRFPTRRSTRSTFTYLLRYVARSRGDAAWSWRGSSSRAARSRVSSSRFPTNAFWRAWWWALHAARAAGRRVSHRRAGVVRGRSFPRTEHLRVTTGAIPLRWIVRMWSDAGLTGVSVRTMSLGGGLVMWATKPAPMTGVRPAFYAARPGPWRDWWTILHPPYTAWHLSYVVIGATLAPRTDGGGSLATLLAFFLRGRRRRACRSTSCTAGRCTRASRARCSLGATVAALGVSLALGFAGVGRTGVGLLVFMALGPMLVLGYNLELFGGMVHSDLGFAAAWGAFPVLTAYFVQAAPARPHRSRSPRPPPRCSPSAQRTLSTQARVVRRRVARVEGTDDDARRQRRTPSTSRTLLAADRAGVAVDVGRDGRARLRARRGARLRASRERARRTIERRDDRQACAVRDRGVRPGRDRRDPRSPRRRAGNAAARQERRGDGAPGRGPVRQGARRDVQLRLVGAVPRGRAARPRARLGGDHVAAHVLHRSRPARSGPG